MTNDCSQLQNTKGSLATEVLRKVHDDVVIPNVTLTAVIRINSWAMEEPWPALIRPQLLSPPAAPNFAERVSGRLSDGRGRAFVLAIRIFDVALPMVTSAVAIWIAASCARGIAGV